MIYTVTWNPSLDYVVDVENFRLGFTNRTKAEKIYPGGKGINVSLMLKNLGMSSMAIGFFAGFTGKEIVRLLEDAGVDADAIWVASGASRINIKIQSQEESEINGIGPLITEDEMEKLYHKLETLQPGDTIVLAGSTPAGMPETAYRDILAHMKKSGLRIVVDATGERLLSVLPYRPFLVKPNHHELGEMFGVAIETKEDAVFYAKRLQERGARNVIVSMAGAGAVFVGDDGSVYECDAPKGKVVNSVGAGDSMVAGFLAGYEETGEYKEAFIQSVCAGSASAFSEMLATKAEVDKLRDRIKKMA